MGRFAIVALGWVTACYAPQAPAGAPCSALGECPSGLVCTTGHTCARSELMDASSDARFDGARDASSDALRDAPPDAPCHGSMTFTSTGAIVTFTVPACTSTITIEAWGAQGGNGFSTHVGGKGAHLKGTFTGQHTLHVLVGAKGLAGSDATAERGGTGGGGSFVADVNNLPLLVAGGGGGAEGGNFAVADGGPGQISQDGQLGLGNGGGAGGTAGGGGGTHSNAGGYQSGTGGGGFTGDGLANSNGGIGGINYPGKAFVHGGNGGLGGSGSRNGGFGGGGAAGYVGGGGGGYSGGGGGGDTGGGGGGSYNTGTAQVAEIGINTGDGRVAITW